MSDSSALGDRMKRYEAATRTTLPRRTHTILRVDGRAFHSYLRGAARPFDDQFMADMDTVAEALCGEISGAVLAYTQSDEISVLITDFGSIGTEPWFGGIVAKQVSIAASLATAVLNERRPGRALFDARVFTIADPVEVANYMLWRQRDAVRNSISMAAQAHFPHGRLHGVNSSGMQELLWSAAGVNWNDYPDGAKRGRVTVRHTGERPVEYVDRRTDTVVRTTAVRSWWETSPAPHFTTAADAWLASRIPSRPAPTATHRHPGGSMSEIADFLRARYAERRAVAEAASPGPWHANAESDEVLAVDGITVAEGFALNGRQLRATTEHIAAHDPEDVIADLDAKLALIDELDAADPHSGYITAIFTAHDALRILARPFAGHPDHKGQERTP